MIASVVLDNIVYLAGAVVLAIILGLAVTLRHRRPKSVEANLESFNKGLNALAPGAEPTKRRGRSAPPPTVPVQRARTVVPQQAPRRVIPDGGTREAETG